MTVEVKCEDAVETYDNVSFNITTPNFIEKLMAKSELVDVSAAHNTEAVAPIDLVRTAAGCDKETVKLQLSGGLNGTAAALTDGDFIGVDKCLKVVYNSLNVIVCTFMTINQNGSLLNITKQGVGFNGRSKKSSFNL